MNLYAILKAEIGTTLAPWPAPPPEPIWALKPSRRPGGRGWRIVSVLRSWR
jgi:hypothetical protein